MQHLSLDVSDFHLLISRLVFSRTPASSKSAALNINLSAVSLPGLLYYTNSQGRSAFASVCFFCFFFCCCEYKMTWSIIVVIMLKVRSLNYYTVCSQGLIHRWLSICCKGFQIYLFFIQKYEKFKKKYSKCMSYNIFLNISAYKVLQKTELNCFQHMNINSDTIRSEIMFN